jgi:hypothetical protein
MTRVIRPGHTLTAAGTVTLAGDLVIDGSSGAYVPHGVGIIASTAHVTSDGSVTVQGGGPVVYTFAPVGGATLAIYGTLANAGALVLTGGSYGIQFSESGGGGYVLDAGVLLNTGSIAVDSGAHLAGQEVDGRGGLLTVTGVLTNQSTMTVQSSTYGNGRFRESHGYGTLTNKGAMTNNGVLVLAGGGMSTVFPGIYGGVGGRFTNDGSFTNAGTLIAEGGAGAYAVHDVGAAGGYAYLSGTVVNDGTMMFDGGAAGFQTHPRSSEMYSVGGGFGAQMAGQVDFTNVGVLIVGAGTATTSARDQSGLGAYVKIGGYEGEGGGSFTNTGTVVVQGGAANPFQAQYAHLYGGDFVITTNGTNTGVISVQSGGFNQYVGGILALTGGLFSYHTFTNTGIISLQIHGAQGGAAGQLQVDDTLQMAGGSVLQSGAGYDRNMVVNRGTITGFGTIDVSSVTNDGMIVAQGGLLRIDANVAQGYQQARFAVDPGATLSLYGAIAKNESLSLSSTGVLIANAAAADLAISSPAGGTMTIVGGGTLSLGAKDTDLTVLLAAPTSLTLSQAGFVTAIGSTGADQIVAEAANQVLQGGGGGDTLIGYTGDGDTFKGTAAQLNGTTIGNFAGSDVIDVTDLMPGADLTLSYTQQTGQGVLTLSEAAQSTTITLLGVFTQSEFSVTSDGASGIFVHP